jgi:hypothetical protein
MHQLSSPFLPPKPTLLTQKSFPHTHSDKYALLFLQINKHRRAHLLVVSFTQRLEKSSTIGVSEISTTTVHLFTRANDSPMRTELLLVKCTTFPGRAHREALGA